MVENAVILIPEEKGPLLPSHLLAPVAGLPLLHRQIFSLWRAGVTTVTIMVPSAAQSDLEQHLAQNHNLFRNVKIISDWGPLWQMQLGSENGPWLALLANVLPDPRFLAEFTHHQVSPGTMALGVVAPPSPAVAAPPPPAIEDQQDKPAGRMLYSLTLENGLVTSLGSSGSRDGLQAAGLVLFSPAAWQDWLSWQMGQSQTGESSLDHIEVSLFHYIDYQAKENKVLGVDSDPLFISVINDDQDLIKATARLIASTKDSPWGKGYLESSLNRKLARKILPWVLDFPVTPNQITIANFFIGLVAVFGFSTGTYWGSLGAALLLPLIIVLDCLDGWVARLKFQESRRGALLDFYGDTVLNLLIFLGIAFGQYPPLSGPLFLGLGLLLTIGYAACCWLLDHPGIRHREVADSPIRGPSGFSRIKKYGKVLEQAVSRDFFYILLLFAFLDLLDWLIIGIAVGTNIFALLLYWRRYGQA